MDMYLVCGCPTPLKNMSSSLGMIDYSQYMAWDDYSQSMEKIKAMIQTTNQTTMCSQILRETTTVMKQTTTKRERRDLQH
jgi:hypothetical protein